MQEDRLVKQAVEVDFLSPVTQVVHSINAMYYSTEEMT
jgi:hypothetical protein